MNQKVHKCTINYTLLQPKGLELNNLKTGPWTRMIIPAILSETVCRSSLLGRSAEEGGLKNKHLQF